MAERRGVATPQPRFHKVKGEQRIGLWDSHGVVSGQNCDWRPGGRRAPYFQLNAPSADHSSCVAVRHSKNETAMQPRSCAVCIPTFHFGVNLVHCGVRMLAPPLAQLLANIRGPA